VIVVKVKGKGWNIAL